MNGETLYAATDYYRPFPDPRAVFADHVDEHSEYLLPVGTLSLNHLSDDWAGDIHFVMPIEPIGGYGVPAEQSVSFHNYLCRPNWIGYHLRGNKLELACDFRIFHKAYYADRPPSDELCKQESEELVSHYADTRRQFASGARHFHKYGWLCSDPENWDSSEPDPEFDDIVRVSLVRNLGGTSFDSNWSNTNDFPISRYPDQYEDRGTTYDCDRVLPKTEDGRDFAYIGEIEMWNYIDYTNGVLVVFYDPLQQIVLTTIDWS